MHVKSSGFTLIELVVVIIILGIIAVTAAPKFLSLSTDARLATLDSLEASMRTAANMVNAKAIVENKTDCATDPTIDLGGTTITLRCGYPCPHPSGIAQAVDADEGFTWVGGNCAGLLGNIDVQITDAPDAANCKIRYAASDGNRPPVYTQTSSGC